MNQIDLLLDGTPLKDSDKLSDKGIGEGGLIYFVITKRPVVQQPKKGMGIAAMIKQFDHHKKNITEEGYQFA